MDVTVSSLALLASGFTVIAWLAYKRGKSAYLKRKEKRKSLPRFASGKVEKFYKGRSKQHRPRLSRNKEKLFKKKIETIVEGNQVTLVTIFSNLKKKNVNKIDVQEPVQNEEIMEEDTIKSMVKTNFSGCNNDCSCSQADHQEPVQNEEIMEEDIIKSMVKTNFSGCNNDCNCSQAAAHTADSGLTSSEDLAKLSEDTAKQPEAMSEENEDGDNGEDFETSNHYTSIKLRETSNSSDDSDSIIEESIIRNKKAGADFEMFQNSTPITFSSQKREFVSKMRPSKIKMRKRPGAVELPIASPEPSSATISGCEHQISKDVEDDDLAIELNMKFETDSNIISKEAAIKETFEAQDYEHPLGVWTHTDGSVIPSWKKDLLPPEPLLPSLHDHDTPRPDVSLLDYLGKFDQEEPKPTAIDKIIEKENLSIVQDLSDSEEVVVSYNNFDVIRTTTAAIRKSSGGEDLTESWKQGLDGNIGSTENYMSDELIEDMFNYPAAKSELDLSMLNTDENMNENVTNSHEDFIIEEIDKPVYSDTPVRAATENETGTSTLFGISNQLLNRSHTNGNGSRSLPEYDYNGQFNEQGNDNKLNNNQGNDGQLKDQGNHDLLNDRGNDVQVNDQGNEYRLNDQRNDDQGNDVQLNYQGSDRQLNGERNDGQLNDQDKDGQLNDQGPSRSSDVGPVVNDREDFEGNEVRLVTIKGDPTFISRILNLLVKKENQDCEEGTTSEELSMKSVSNKTAASKSHIFFKNDRCLTLYAPCLDGEGCVASKTNKQTKAQGNQNTLDSQMSEKKISDEGMITSDNEDSLGGPNLIHSTLPWHSPTQILPTSKSQKLKNLRDRKK